MYIYIYIWYTCLSYIFVYISFVIIFAPDWVIQLELFAEGVLSEDEELQAVFDLLSRTQTQPTMENEIKLITNVS